MNITPKDFAIVIVEIGKLLAAGKDVSGIAPALLHTPTPASVPVPVPAALMPPEPPSAPRTVKPGQTKNRKVKTPEVAPPFTKEESIALARHNKRPNMSWQAPLRTVVSTGAPGFGAVYEYAGVHFLGTALISFYARYSRDTRVSYWATAPFTQEDADSQHSERVQKTVHKILYRAWCAIANRALHNKQGGVDREIMAIRAPDYEDALGQLVAEGPRICRHQLRFIGYIAMDKTTLRGWWGGQFTTHKDSFFADLPEDLSQDTPPASPQLIPKKVFRGLPMAGQSSE